MLEGVKYGLYANYDIYDYLGNLDLWHEKGGISVKFSTTDKVSKYYKIDNLRKLIPLYEQLNKQIQNNKKVKIK